MDLPIFVITRPVDSDNGILYPDFTFFAWPEATCRTSGDAESPEQRGARMAGGDPAAGGAAGIGQHDH